MRARVSIAISVLVVLALLTACAPAAPTVAPTTQPAKSPPVPAATLAPAAPTVAPTTQPAKSPPVPTATLAPAAPVAPKAAPTATALAKAKRGGVLTGSVVNHFTSMFGQRSTAGSDEDPQRLIYDLLIDTDEKGNILPMLAESWEIGPKDITFKLRKAKFHDGTDFNAKAAKFNIDLILDPKTKSTRISDLADVVGAEVIDDYTFRLLLKGPSAPTFAGLVGLAGFIASPTAVGRWGIEQYLSHPVGTGPFEFVEWVKDDRVITKRFDGYWMKDKAGEKLPYLDGVTYRSITDDSVRLIELRTGNIQLMDTVVAKDVALIKADKALVYYPVPGNPWHYRLNFNTKVPPFDRKGLRQALSWATDREAFVKALAFGEGEIAKGWWAEGQWMYDPAAKGFDYDTKKSRELLAQAGFPDGLKETLVTMSRPEDQRIAQIIQAQWRNAAIDLTLDVLERTAAMDRFRLGNFKMGIQRNPTMPDPALDLKKYVTGSSDNYSTNYSNARFDQLEEQARRTYDRAERIRLYTELNSILMEDVPSLELYKQAWAHAVSAKLKGFATNARGMWNCTACWLE